MNKNNYQGVVGFKGRIVLLSAFGAFAICFITLTNLAFDRSREQALEVGARGQVIAESIIRQELLMEKYVQGTDHAWVKEIQVLQEQVEGLYAEIPRLTRDPAVLKALDLVKEHHRELLDTFSRMTTTLTRMNLDRASLINEMDALNKLIVAFNGFINQDETSQILRGGELAATKVALRSMSKALLVQCQQQLISLQALHIDGDAKKYEEHQKALDERIRTLVTNIRTVLEHVDDASYHETWKRIENSLESITSKGALLFVHWQSNRRLVKELEDHGRKAMETALDIEHRTRERSARIRRQSFMAGVVISLVSLLVFAVFSALIIRRTMGVLGGDPGDMARMAGQIAAGRLAEALSSAQSAEQRQGLFASMIRMSENLARIIREVAGSSAAMSDSSRRLTSIASRMTEAAKSLTLEMNGAVRATERISANIRAVAASAREMAEQALRFAASTREMATDVQQVAGAVEKISASVSEVGRSCTEARGLSRKAKEESEESSRLIGELQQAALDVGQVVGIIDRITEQTKLLALNADIEAAAAGEAGRGFAVVASEVKELAAQTARATGDITGKVEEMLARTARVAQAMESVARFNGEVNEVNQVIASAVEEQTGTAREIARTVADTARAADDISRNIQSLAEGLGVQVVDPIREAAGGVDEILGNTRMADEVAEDTARNSSEVHETAVELSRLAALLQEQVARFQLTMEEDAAKEVSGNPAEGQAPREQGKTGPETDEAG